MQKKKVVESSVVSAKKIGGDDLKNMPPSPPPSALPLFETLPEPPNQNETMLIANKVILKQLVNLTEQMAKFKKSKVYKDSSSIVITKPISKATDHVGSSNKGKDFKGKKRDVDNKLPTSKGVKKKKAKTKKNEEAALIENVDDLFMADSDLESSDEEASRRESLKGDSTSDSDSSSNSSSSDDSKSSKENKAKSKSSNKEGPPAKRGIRFDVDSSKESSTGLKYTTVPPLGRVPAEMLQYYDERIEELKNLYALNSNTLDNMRSLPKKVIKDMKTHLRNQEDTMQKSQKECIRLRGERAFIQVELETLKSKLEQLESSYVKFESSLQTEFQYEMSRHNNRQLIGTGYHDKTTGELMQKIDKLRIDVKFKDTKIKHQEDVIKNYSNEISKLECSNTDVEVACELRKKNINRLEDVIKGCYEERRAIEEEVRLLNIFVEDLTIELNKRNDSIKVYRAENDVFNAQVAFLEERDGIFSTNLVSFRNNLLEAQAKCKKSQAECLVLETALNKVKNELVQSKNKFSHLKITANVEITLQASEVKQGVSSAAARLSIIHSTHKRAVNARLSMHPGINPGGGVASLSTSLLPINARARGQQSVLQKVQVKNANNMDAVNAPSTIDKVEERDDEEDEEVSSEQTEHKSESRPHSGASIKSISRPNSNINSRPNSRTSTLKRLAGGGTDKMKKDNEDSEASNENSESEIDAEGLKPSKPSSQRASAKVSPRVKFAGAVATTVTPAATDKAKIDGKSGNGNKLASEPFILSTDSENFNKVTENIDTDIKDAENKDKDKEAVTIASDIKGTATEKEKVKRSKTPKTPEPRTKTPKTAVREEDIPDKLTVDDYLDAEKVALVLKSKEKTAKVLKDLTEEKKKVKKVISKWISNFEQKNAREPSEEEKQKEMSSSFDLYNKYTFMITKITEKAVELKIKESRAVNENTEI